VLIGARILIAVVFLLNGFGIINKAIPAKEMMERGVPPAVVPFAMFAGRFLEIAAGLGLMLGIFPRWSALLLFSFLVPAMFVSHSFWLTAGTPQFQGQLINFCKNLANNGADLFSSLERQISPRCCHKIRHDDQLGPLGWRASRVRIARPCKPYRFDSRHKSFNCGSRSTGLTVPDFGRIPAFST